MDIYNRAGGACRKSNLLTEWFELADSSKLMPAFPKIGWGKIAWTYGLHYLKYVVGKAPSELTHHFYAEAMRTVI